MGIDMASVYAAKYRKNPDVLRAAVMGQSPDASLDSYTALNALKLVKEADMMAMSGMAQQPTSSPSIVAEALTPAPSARGLGAMVPNMMGQAPQGMPPQGMPPQQVPMPQQPMQAASGGLASMPTPDEDYAEGGIVAFQNRGFVDPAYTANATGNVAYAGSSPAVSANPSYSEGEGDGMGLENLAFTSKGDPDTYAALAKLYPGAIASLGNITETEIKPETLRKIGTDEIKAFKDAMGPNTAEESLLADIKARKGERERNLEEGKGAALLKAAYAVTQGNNWIRAFAGAGAAFGDEYNRALQADKVEKRSIASAEFNLADSKRKESLGLFKEGRAAEARYVSAVKAADKARLDKAKAYADAIKGGMNATKPLRSAFSGAGNASTKLPQVDREAAAITKQIIALEAKDPNDPQLAILKKQLVGLKEILATGKDYGPTKAGSEEAKLTETVESNIDKDVNKQAIFDPAYQKAMAAGDAQGMSDAKLAIRRRIIANRQATQGKPSDGGVNKNSTTAPDISTIKGAPAGSTIGKSTAKGWEVLDPSGTVIGYAQK